jgi:hypothetical protein
MSQGPAAASQAAIFPAQAEGLPHYLRITTTSALQTAAG